MISQPDPRLRTSMGLVLLACLPGLLALLWLHGWGMLLNLLLSATAALLCEAVLLALRGQTLSTALGDGSALVTAVLLAAALPTLAPWWLPVVAASVAIGFGKQAFGGVGRNPFNPAMVGYAFVLLSFPLQMNHWPGQPPGLLDSLQQVFTGGEQIDAWARPTLLDGLRHNRSLTIEELFASHPGFGNIGGRGSEWVNLAFLLGGLFLLQRNVISWHAPLGLLTGLFVFSLLGWNGSGSDSNGSPLLHLFSGSTMLAAFFIATEPVSGPRNERARLYFGLGAGLLIYLIRTWGSYPDGTAFAVLLMNLMAPTLERLTAQPQQAAR
ncbi:RnfABCDGE type electron transport complex subunit D [Pseudomonas monteilii]|jgi:electron transport complex protein RnfD|uniref:Ion-translocating oxidoreductase complex subunit D n=1 Tax=Pseudomonas putida TaxID=303 RepID=A0A7U6M5S3_PSEPU|nr:MULTISPECIES: RnfABCDGE type electron transport complex subunit D [Pseudomonas]MBB3272019.1 electron transport complex protein RnfD [Pseudomonas sp. OG7]MBH3395664.1 RnfABCDGE type electron transport complex subunit D [Pseudomonas monteilii]MBH3456840.1 RnfABCDGE type electron transport complex subunit D [Pseudomonas monteilii]MDD2125644.1 RnfABCDGE type electron transport complex subunit D [Pseudomonas monteilii]PXX67426.1 electron transport complex protein RnfD [Pseudomonas sp. LAIL14HWK1